ncbi:MAG TPA: M23 family metallopeptidase [Stellaceae bacterium]|jgi:murein DD-endopeptidase MepM/ murein hydrolase activator NlpD|nr:M23 family metallopeptidase [Stellaceae bacterium]
MSARIFLTLTMLLLAVPATAATLSLDGPLEQGALIRGQTDSGARVSLNGNALRVAPDGHFLFGFGRDAEANAALDVVGPDGGVLHRDLVITARQYDIRRIDGLPPESVSPGPDTLARIKREAALIEKAIDVSSDDVSFEQPLLWPAAGTISGIYGSQSIMNGQPRSPHFGVDIAAPAGTSIHASAAGTVTLAEPDLYFTGGTIIIDHGYGLSTLYVHLQKFSVAVGQRVTAGQTIGEMGATGRATGPNLHWGVNWNGVRLDPALVAGPMPSPASGDAARTTAPAALAPSAPPSH